MQEATCKTDTKEAVKIYVASAYKSPESVMIELLGKKVSFVNNLDEADTVLIEDGFFKSSFLTEIFRKALRRKITIRHFGGEETKNYLFSLVKQTVCKVKKFEEISGSSRKRDNVIYRAAISVFLLKCGIHETEVAPFVGRQRSNMFHYVKLHPIEMKMTSLYEVVYTSLIAML